MKYQVINKDLFTVDLYKYCIVHCISADFALGAGVAAVIETRFQIRDMLKATNPYGSEVPNCIFTKGIFSLVTKKNYWNKPTYESLAASLKLMKNLIEHLNEPEQGHNIKYLAMPTIGCGLDRLSWPIVEKIIKETFEDTDLNILVCDL